MGHRALVAYERPDQSYNLHYSHWGGCNLRLKQEITETTPFGSPEPPEADVQAAFESLLEADPDVEDPATLDRDAVPDADVGPDPLALGLSWDTIVTTYLDFRQQEAIYVVDRDFEVTAYRTHWFGLQHDCESIDDGPIIGHGALQTVRWYDGEPVGDGFTRGQFQGLRVVVGDMVDRGVFSERDAIEYMHSKLKEWRRGEQELDVWVRGVHLPGPRSKRV